jgi:type I restriction enzyme S subunit
MREDWIECELGEVCNINMGQSPPSSTYNIEKKGLPFFQGKAEFTDLYPVVRKWCTKPTRIANDGDILLSVRAPVGSTNIANQECAIGRGLAAISYPYSYKIIWFYLKAIEQQLDKQGTGTTFRAVSGSVVRKQIFPLAPLPIQRAIVSKIEALFSDLDNGIANFKKAQEQLKIYRQAVLKKAFEGELTKVLFDDWEYSTLKESVKFSQGIQVDVNLQSENKSNNSVRFLRIIDFTQGIDPARYIENPGEKYIVRKDDVSLVRYGASTGFVCSNLEGAIANNLFRIIPVKPIDKKYLYYFLCSPLFQNIISQSVKGAAMPAISFGLINDVVLSFPKNISDQAQIVQEIERRLSVCDKMEQSINESIEKAEALRQSILKKAFEGKLLSKAEIELCKKETDYEPASELLKKIQAEKLAKEQEKKKPIVKKKSKQ